MWAVFIVSWPILYAFMVKMYGFIGLSTEMFEKYYHNVLKE
jgi:hypothetical protein